MLTFSSKTNNILDNVLENSADTGSLKPTKFLHISANSPLNLIDTHCHLNMLVKKDFDILMTPEQLEAAGDYINQAAADHVTTIINVGTSLPESLNSVALAQKYSHVFATIGIHPNDCTENWRQDFRELELLLKNTPSSQTQAELQAISGPYNFRDTRNLNNGMSTLDYEHSSPARPECFAEQNVSKGASVSRGKIVGIGECGIDMYRPGYNLPRQQDAFKAHIELALEHDLALVIHSRTAAQETLRILDTYAGQITRATMHCFSYDLSIAQDVIKNGFFIGIDAPITYPKNTELRTVVQAVPLENIVLETDAPFLPPQQLRGSANHPKHIKTIAAFIAELRGVTLEDVAAQTTANARKLFGL